MHCVYSEIKLFLFLFIFMCKGKVMGKGVPLWLTKQIHLDLQTNLMVSWLVLILYYTSVVTMSSIDKDKISKLLCLSVLFSVTKTK